MEAVTPGAGDAEQVLMDQLASKLLRSPDNQGQDRTVNQKLTELRMLTRTVCFNNPSDFRYIYLATVLGSKIREFLPGRVQGSALC